MTTTTERIHLREEAASAKIRSIVWPGAIAVLLFVVIVYIQFSLVLGQLGFPVEFAIAIGFYYCWAWHNRLAEKAAAKDRAAEKA